MLSVRKCIHKTSLWIAIALAGASLSLSGCQSKTTDPVPSAQLKLGFSLQSPELASLVDLVTLTMVYPDTTKIVDTIPVIDGEIHDTIAVTPADPIVFTLRAFDKERQRVLYIGSETRPVGPGQLVQINILLVPNPDLLMLRAGPIFQSSALEAGGFDSVFVDIANVDSLGYVAFRIRFDTLVLNFYRVIEGDFLKPNPTDSTFSFALKDTSGIVAYAVGRLGNRNKFVPGVSGSGRLVTFLFTKRAAGTTAITIEPEAVYLERPTSEGLAPVRNFESLVLESATVEVVQTTGPSF